MRTSIFLVVKSILDCCGVAIDTQARNHPNSLIRKIRMVSEWFSGVDIGDVDFDEGKGATQEGISDSDRSVSVCTGIDNDEFHAFLLGLLDSINYEALGIVLVGEELGTFMFTHLSVSILFNIS